MKLSILMLFSLILLNSGASIARADLTFGCERTFLVPSLELSSTDWGIQINSIDVTGLTEYPLKTVLEDLQLTPDWIKEHKSKTILSLAEGMSGLIPFLSAQGVSAYGTDLWYGHNFPKDDRYSILTQFQDAMRSQIFPSDVRELPLANESIDVILAHKLYNNLHLGDSLGSLVEIVRVLRPQGEARLADISPLAFRHIAIFLEKTFAEDIEWQYDSKLLILKKKKSLPSLHVVIPYDSRLRYPGIPNGTKTFELPWASE